MNFSFNPAGLVTEFRYCMKLAWGITDYGQLGGLIDYGWGMARDDRAFVFVDNHDNQRGHGGAGNNKIRCRLYVAKYIYSL